MDEFNFAVKAKVVSSGNSKVFKTFVEGLPNLTEDMFLKELKWLCEDPTENGKLTRELGLTAHGIVRLYRRVEHGLTVIRYADGKTWDGDFFYRPCNDKRFADKH